MTRKPETLIRSIARRAGPLVAGMALASAGLFGLAPVAHASTQVYNALCGGKIGDGGPAASDFPVGCTVPTFPDAWNPARTQTQTGDITVTNHADYSVHIGTENDSGTNGTAPGDVREVVEVPPGGIELPAHDSTQIPVSYTFYGPFTSDVIPAGHGVPVATVPVGWNFQVYGPWRTYDDMSALANYPVTNSGGGGSSSPPVTTPPTTSSNLSPLAVAGSHVEPAGQPDPLWVANTKTSGSEWLTMCVDGRAVASGNRNPGGLIKHAVPGPADGSTVTYDAYAGSSPARCSGAEQTFTVTGESEGPAYPVPNLHAFAAATTSPVGSEVPVYVTDTASGPTWISLCEGGRAVASGWHQPGTSLEHNVTSGTAGTVNYTAMQGRASCSNGIESSAQIDWTN